MSNQPFTDEILSAIIDGEADPDIVAAVAADPVASARLAQLGAVVAMVAAPAADAEPVRRSASIAAAMAAAKPAADVTSLAAARHVRETKTRRLDTRRWLGVAAAAVALVVAIPLLANLRSDSVETATTDTTTEDRGLSAVEEAEEATAAGDSSDDSASDAVEGVGRDQATGESESQAPAVSADEAMDETLDQSEADPPADEEPSPATTAASIDRFLADARVFSNVEILDEMILLGSITPELTIDQVVELGVSPDCAVPLEFTNEPQFAVAYLDDGLAERRLILISFNEDETTTALDAEDCSLLR